MMKKNNMKKKSTARKLLPAAGMLAVSASMLATSTYAWFTMNKTVEVKGMEVKAKAEKGLLVNEIPDVGSATWDEEALSNANANATLIPMSTSDAIKWAHANSTKADSAAEAASNAVSADLSAAGYQIFTLASEAGGSSLTSGKLDFINVTAAAAGANAKADIYYQEKDTTTGAIGDNDDGAFIKYTYYLKSSGSAAITLDQNCSDAVDNTIYVKTIKVTGLDAATGETPAIAHNLDKTLRVAVVPTGGTATIYAPVAGADTSYNVATAYTAASGETPASLTTVAATLQPGSAAITAGESGKVVSTWNATGTGATEGITLATLPATTSPGAAVDVYLWFEGEDLNCKTNEIYSELDQLTVDITFGLK